MLGTAGQQPITCLLPAMEIHNLSPSIRQAEMQFTVRVMNSHTRLHTVCLGTSTLVIAQHQSLMISHY